MNRKEIIEIDQYSIEDFKSLDYYKIIDLNLLLFLTVVLLLNKIYNFIIEKIKDELETENYRNEISLIDDQLDKMLLELNADKIVFGKIIFINDVEFLRIVLEKSKEYIKRFYKRDVKIPLNMILNYKEISDDFIKKYTYENCDFLKLYDVKSFIRLVNSEKRFIIGIYYIDKDIELTEDIKKILNHYNKKIGFIVNKNSKGIFYYLTKIFNKIRK